MTGAAPCLTFSFMDRCRSRFTPLGPASQPLACAAGTCPAAIFTLFPATCGANERKIAPDGRLGQRLQRSSGGGEG